MFPQELKSSRVSPVYKNGTRNNPSNCRPISVIPTVAKIFEIIVYDQIYEYLNGYNLLNASQSGFRSLHSTLTALLEATNSWSVNIDNGLVNGVVFIDSKKAFDTIDHKIMLQTFGNKRLGWIQIVLDGLNHTSVIEPKSVELMASVEIKTRDLRGSTREQFGPATVPLIH